MDLSTDVGGRPIEARWAGRPTSPRSIRRPEEFDGSTSLAISCTQTELSAKAQKDLVREWCAVLPTLSSVRCLWFHTKVPQELFDAASRLPALESLSVKWSSIRDLGSIRDAQSLWHLKIGPSPGILDIRPIQSLLGLRWLELANIKAVQDLSPISELSGLEGFGFVGKEGGPNSVDSFEPLSPLGRLRWLHLGGLRVAGDSLRPLGTLSDLRYLGIGNFFPMQEFAWLSSRLTNTDCVWLKGGYHLGNISRCRRCNGGMVILAGKGQGTICPICSSKRWELHQAAFAEAALA